MALNLWKLQKGVTSYNPLPSSTITLNLPIGDYVVKIKAKSETNRILKCWVNNQEQTTVGMVTLSNTVKEYVFSKTILSTANTLAVADGSFAVNDIIIEDIQLVQKPLPKLTINGIDGFASGKWTLHANSRVIDDETLELNATAQWQRTDITVAVPTGYTVYFNVETTNGSIRIYKGNSILNTLVLSDKGTFVTDSSYNGFVTISLTNGAITAGAFTFKRPILNLGSTPAPYEKKRGERMVLPNVKKNLFPFSSSLKGVGTSSGAWINPINGVNASGGITLGYPISLQKGKSYTLSGNLIEGTDFQLLNTDASIILSSSSKTITPIKDETFYFRVKVGVSLGYQLENFQLEQGTTATPYTPYAVQMNAKPKRYVLDVNGKEVLPRAKSGVAFNGTSDYLQLPSMTMDSIEIDCLIENGNVLFQSSNNSIYARTNGTGAWINGTIPVLPTNTRIKTRYNFEKITGGFSVMSNNVGSNATRGVLYGIKCYLNGQVVAQYDANNIIGDKLLQKAVNLIPSFEDSRWSLHTNFKALGKDVGRLDATSGTNANSYIDIPCNADFSYLMGYTGNGGIVAQNLDVNKNAIGTNTSQIGTGLKQVPSLQNRAFIRFYCNNNGVIGSFDFIKPSLYQLDGTEGTLVGSPTKLKRASKRTLYAKR